MPRHRLTLRERLAGVEKAAASLKTPRQLREGLRKHAQRLRRELRRRRRA